MAAQEQRFQTLTLPPDFTVHPRELPAGFQIPDNTRSRIVEFLGPLADVQAVARMIGGMPQIDRASQDIFVLYDAIIEQRAMGQVDDGSFMTHLNRLPELVPTKSSKTLASALIELGLIDQMRRTDRAKARGMFSDFCQAHNIDRKDIISTSQVGIDYPPAQALIMSRMIDADPTLATMDNLRLVLALRWHFSPADEPHKIRELRGSLSRLAYTAYEEDSFQDAYSLYMASVELAEAVEDPTVYTPLSNAALIECRLDKFDDARAHMRKAIDLAKQKGVAPDELAAMEANYHLIDFADYDKKSQSPTVDEWQTVLATLTEQVDNCINNKAVDSIFELQLAILVILDRYLGRAEEARQFKADLLPQLGQKINEAREYLAGADGEKIIGSICQYAHPAIRDVFAGLIQEVLNEGRESAPSA